MVNKISTVTYSASAVTIYGGMSLNEWLAIGGFVVAVLAAVLQICVTIYYKQKHLELARAKASITEDEEQQ